MKYHSHENVLKVLTRSFQKRYQAVGTIIAKQTNIFDIFSANISKCVLIQK